MSYDFHGQHLIAGARVDAAERFASSPATGPSRRFANGTPALVDTACRAAEEAFESFGWSTRETRARLLEGIAGAIEGRAADLTEIAMQESGLPEARLVGERGRTTGQLRYFAALIRGGDYLDLRHDAALPDRQPLPRPELRMMQRPIGPVAVFGASNFPLAFSVAGGDTASALAAACPVVVKGHPAHPGTSEIVAEAIAEALRAAGLPGGCFSLIHGDSVEVGTTLVQHPLIRAVGFTGSLRGGRALFDLCAARAEPIPFFGELGSVNPVFVLHEALRARGQTLGEGWAASLTMGAGQFCTNPGVLVLPAGAEGADSFVTAAVTALEGAAPQTMLTDGIAEAFRAGAAGLEALGAVLLRNESRARSAAPVLLRVTAEQFLRERALQHEVFGPLGVIVEVAGDAELLALARGLEGQLTATLQMDAGDMPLARRLLPVLERKVGRVLANGWPTGVEVADAMVHGGPYPASTNFGATSVGGMAIRRFLRPVCYQNLPMALLPEELARPLE
ncbi:aldehyde dehydrogenase (NADP(+)) [Natronohydrobacter thiooxidans]|uniref:aldehyde dehydrogenase (NADP(+)) n=1 Tax=Natronohydrobacter thiooxidans TaxID=87172 RepID=UPI0008FF0BE4|nr:aldehyde dehydrogenase (NADP(+)) [Natronohydrobacter thiooxidans]